ncbi:MAG TPA: 2-C-methyl-D-erythritol 4-phosphate cytidylyltransferase [Bacteroidota bacterium]|nr:2-C-methyl-D-erythritol 4-phosphate cytidylyltransferase [Bacteroidota bacterium]
MSAKRPKVFAVLPAAGSGTRLGGVRKQFLELKGKPVIVHTLLQFENTPEVDEIAIAVPESDIVTTEQLISRYRILKVRVVVAGGERRQDSVYNAFKNLNAKPTDIVLVHDGVRPFVHPKQISNIISICEEHEAAVMAVQPKDTVRRSNGGGFFDATLDRNALWLIQTPQAFKADVLQRAFDQARKEKFFATDEAALVERLGIKIRIVEGSYDNIKITTQEDLELGSLILERWR